MEWNKKLATGVDEFDKMYPVMIENVNASLRLLAASRSVTDYRKHVDAIKMEFIRLFSYQESLMYQQKYPQYYQHKHHHEQLQQRREDTPRHAEHGALVALREVAVHELLKEESTLVKRGDDSLDGRGHGSQLSIKIWCFCSAFVRVTYR